MPDYTTNYNLVKPREEDFYDIGHFNENSDIIDAELKKLNDTREITAEEIIAMYGGDVDVGDIGEAGIGVSREDIDDMYNNDVTYMDDTGIPNNEIDDLYKN